MLSETSSLWYLEKEGDTGALHRTRDEVVKVEVPQYKSIVSVQYRGPYKLAQGEGNALNSPERLRVIRENAMQQGMVNGMVAPTITKRLSVDGKWID